MGSFAHANGSMRSALCRAFTKAVALVAFGLSHVALVASADEPIAETSLLANKSSTTGAAVLPVAGTESTLLAASEGAAQADSTAYTEPCVVASEVDWGSDESLLDNLSFFAGLNGSKQPQDFGVNAQFGARVAVNWALPIWKSQGIGFQVGTTVDPLYNAVDVLDANGLSDDRFQNFTTVGVFQRMESGWSWGLSHDFLYQNYFFNSHLSQWRGVLSYKLRDADEVGSWFAIRDRGGSGVYAGQPIELRGISQGTLFWRHLFANAVRTTAWVGVADPHDTPILVIPANTSVSSRVTFGADLRVPLNDWAAIWGEANFIAPYAEGTVDAYLGIEVYPRRNADTASTRRFAPIMAVASNPTFAVNLRRQ